VIQSAYKIERRAGGKQNIVISFIRIPNLISCEWDLALLVLLISLVFGMLGLKDILGELPKREASLFRSQVPILLGDRISLPRFR